MKNKAIEAILPDFYGSQNNVQDDIRLKDKGLGREGNRIPATLTQLFERALGIQAISDSFIEPQLGLACHFGALVHSFQLLDSREVRSVTLVCSTEHPRLTLQHVGL